MMMMAGFGALAAALPAPTAWADPSVNAIRFRGRGYNLQRFLEERRHDSNRPV